MGKIIEELFVLALVVGIALELGLFWVFISLSRAFGCL